MTGSKSSTVRTRWWIASALLALFILAVAFPFMWRSWVDHRYGRDIVAVADAMPTRVAIVFGARVYGDGRLSSMVRDRVDTAVELYQTGKVEKLLFSGDNRFDDYNEPADMMTYAAQRGVPVADMQPDYGGRRTYDTCYRAQSIFGVDQALLVTQRFHLPRALFTCTMLGVQVQGVAADRRTYGSASIQWSESRELPATLVALLDIVRRAPPPVMGEPIRFSRHEARLPILEASLRACCHSASLLPASTLWYDALDQNSAAARSEHCTHES